MPGASETMDTTSARHDAYNRFVETIFTVVITVGIVQTVGLFFAIPSPPFALLLVGLMFVAFSWVYYHLGVAETPYNNTWASWTRFFLDVAIAGTYIGLFLTVTNFLQFGIVLFTLNVLYGLHGLATARQVGWRKIVGLTVKPTGVPAYWMTYAFVFLITGLVAWHWSPLPVWEQYVFAGVFAVEIILSRFLRHFRVMATVHVFERLHLQPKLDPLVVAVDIDGVLADQVPHVLARARMEKRVEMHKEEVVEWRTMVGDEPFDRLILRYLADPNFVKSMPSISGAAEAIRDLHKDAIIKIATSRPESSMEATIEWVREKLGWTPEITNTILAGKSNVDADVLIDDRDQNVLDFVTRAGRKGVLMHQPWNRDSPLLESLVREEKIFVAQDWEHVRALFAIGPGAR